MVPSFALDGAARARRLVAASLLAVPAFASAGGQTFHCGMNHYVRNGGTEMLSTTLTVRNLDGLHPATIRRLTVRDGDGQIVFDAGPDGPAPLPPNTDFPLSFPGGKDVSTIAPHGTVYLRSNHLWGNASLPGAAGNETGQALSATVTLAKEGRRDALTVTATQRFRTRVPGTFPGSFAETDTRATGTTVCVAQP